MQVALAVAVRAAKFGYGMLRLLDAAGDTAFQVMNRPRDDDLLKNGIRQQIVDMPSSGLLLTRKNLDVSIHPLQAAGSSGRAGVGVEACCKVQQTKRADPNLLRPAKMQYQGVDSRLIALQVHIDWQDWRIFEIDAS